MKFVFSVFLLLLGLASQAQPIANANLRYWYDPDNSGQFDLKVVRGPDSVYAYYRVDTTIFTVSWERRESYGQRSGDALEAVITSAPGYGRLGFARPEKPWLLVAALKDKRTQEIRYNFHQIEGNYPPDGMIWSNNKPLFDNFVSANTEVVFTNFFAPKLKVYFYSERFPAASPPFAEKEKRVDPLMEVDSSFFIQINEPTKFQKEGLYLVQSDTNSARGIAFRVTAPSYPKTTRIEDLSSSLVFISTKDEADQLKAAGADKAKFDKIVLDITRDKERAKTLIRHYFRRVELANLFFTSYKEGWKTDRGMMYLVFGCPDEINRNGQYEVWTYKSMNSRFTFVKTGSVYDPDYYVLERNKRFAESWYYSIDMWRKSQITSAVRN